MRLDEVRYGNGTRSELVVAHARSARDEMDPLILHQIHAKEPLSHTVRFPIARPLIISHQCNPMLLLGSFISDILCRRALRERYHRMVMPISSSAKRPPPPSILRNHNIISRRSSAPSPTESSRGTSRRREAAPGDDAWELQSGPARGYARGRLQAYGDAGIRREMRVGTQHGRCEAAPFSGTSRRATGGSRVGYISDGGRGIYHALLRRRADGE
ncbi:hypothetical protein C8R44DRAFT_871739 [Mycena epipterygia]|nr:hypothetical protein C8R44DRAFT_871739 [Mycena epipterygia]